MQLLTNHYERCWKYYCLPGGWSNFGAASEEELHLSRKLFWGIFDALSQKVIEDLGGGFVCIDEATKSLRFSVRWWVNVFTNHALNRVRFDGEYLYSQH